MKIPLPAKPISGFAWQPLTPRGVAAFAPAPWQRLFLVQFIFAMLTAGTVVWFFSTAWFPTIREAIQQLPARGEIHTGTLAWSGDSPRLLAEGRLLAFTVDVHHQGTLRPPAHFQVEFGTNTVRVFSLFGFRDFAYPKDYIVAFNRTELEPWWGAWQTPILWMTVAAVMVCLLLTWAALASIYCFPAWLIGFFANRKADFGNSWKLAGATLMPGALLLTAAIFFYGLGVLDLIRLLVAAMVHWVLGWIYLVWAVFALPPAEPAISLRRNPFASPQPDPAREEKTSPPPGAST